MKQLSGLDAAFLYMETPSTFGHVTGLMIFERPSLDFDPYTAVHEMYASLVGRVEPMRRRLAEVPFNLDHPYWVFDAGFDIDYHIRQLNIPAPGYVDQLAEQVARIVGRPLDRTRPLWEIYVIEGLANGWWALLTKYHHATIDGAAGQLMLEMVLSQDPDAPPPEPGPDWEPEEMPSPAELLRLTAEHMVQPAEGPAHQHPHRPHCGRRARLNSMSGVASAASDLLRKATGREVAHHERISLPTTPAPPTPWNKAITPHRRFAMRTTSLENVKRLKQATGGTVNDVVMAICAGGLREYLIHHDALPEQPLRAMVPVSIRTGNEDDPWTNRVSSIFAELPTNVEDPIERVHRCREAMAAAKRQLQLLPADAIIEISQTAPPVLSTAAVRLASQLKLADRFMMPVNLVVSNVPGPRTAVLPRCPDAATSSGVDRHRRSGLNITVQSYVDRLDFGFIVDRELVPDVWDLADMHVAEIERMFVATGAERAEPPLTARPRRGPMQQVIARQQAEAAQPVTPAPAKKTAPRKKTRRGRCLLPRSADVRSLRSGR